MRRFDSASTRPTTKSTSTTKTAKPSAMPSESTSRRLAGPAAPAAAVEVAAPARGAGAVEAAPVRSATTIPKAVRAWAETQGIEVSQRGRVPADLIAKFQAADA